MYACVYACPSIYPSIYLHTKGYRYAGDAAPRPDTGRGDEQGGGQERGDYRIRTVIGGGVAAWSVMEAGVRDGVDIWPLHNIAITNIVWCMAYQRRVGGASYIA